VKTVEIFSCFKIEVRSKVSSRHSDRTGWEIRVEFFHWHCHVILQCHKVLREPRATGHRGGATWPFLKSERKIGRSRHCKYRLSSSNLNELMVGVISSNIRVIYESSNMNDFENSRKSFILFVFLLEKLLDI